MRNRTETETKQLTSMRTEGIETPHPCILTESARAAVAAAGRGAS